MTEEGMLDSRRHSFFIVPTISYGKGLAGALAKSFAFMDGGDEIAYQIE